MAIGNSAYLYENVYPTNATNKCVKWTSSNSGVVTVNPDSGLAYASGEGIATITATSQDGSNKKGTCIITVEPFIKIESFNVYPSVKTVMVGEAIEFDTIVCPTNATNKSVRWSIGRILC